MKPDLLDSRSILLSAIASVASTTGTPIGAAGDWPATRATGNKFAAHAEVQQSLWPAWTVELAVLGAGHDFSATSSDPGEARRIPMQRVADFMVRDDLHISHDRAFALGEVVH
ncbi:MAG: hypothetical protein QNJ16_07280 [Rhodobacter sp.]|nr:hypothetical protein [Rhodobacter sp.]